jgi:hypothetical protein
MRVVVGLGKWLLHEAVEAIAPVIGGCAGALVGHQCGDAGAGRAVGGGLERAIDYFGKRIIERWLERRERQDPEERRQALEELASMPPAEVRRETEALLTQLHLSFAAADRQVALDYLTAIPPALARTLGRAASRRGTMPADHRESAPALLRLLPADVPPYAAPCPLPGTSYQLEEFIGAGGFGAVYRAADPRVPYMPLAVKICHGPAAVPALRRERDTLKRLIETGAAGWSPRVLRLYGYDLEHSTPYLVSEWAANGDLAAALAARSERPSADEVLCWVEGIAEGLAFVHRHGVVHRDLKPANVLLADGGVKLADFGIGGLAVGAAAADRTVSLLRGAGTPLYMSPEQRRGEAPDPRHDLYSLGVIWYQLLLGDETAELHPGWEDDLRDAAAPEGQVALIRRCVGPAKKRPADGGELLNQMRDPTLADDGPVPEGLLDQIERLRDAHADVESASRPGVAGQLLGVFVLFACFVATSGGFAGIAEAAFRNDRDHGMPWIPLVVCGGTVAGVALGLVARRRLLRRAEVRRSAPQRHAVARAADVLAKVFPAAVAAWGGRDILLRREDVERIAGELAARAAVPPRERRRSFAIAPVSAAPDRSAGTAPPAQRTAPGAANGTLLRELVRQFRAAHADVAGARPSPPPIRAVAAAIALYSFAALGGLTVALPVVFIALEGSTLGQAVAIPLVSLAGACLSGWVSFLLSRWYLRYQRRKRLEKPLRDLADRFELIERAFPDEVRDRGGRGSLLDEENVRETCRWLEGLAKSNHASGR